MFKKLIAGFLKRLIKQDSFMYKYLQAKKRYGLFSPPHTSCTVNELLQKFNDLKKEQVFFFQIGANDGIKDDPIHNFVIANKWKGILVEPLPGPFSMLQKNYAAAHDRLLFENVAVSNKSGELPFYIVSNTENLNYRFDFTAFSSFNKEVLVKNFKDYPEIVEHIEEIKIKTTTIHELLAKHAVSQVDLLLIDTEGYDFEILKTIDFSNFRPDLLIFEVSNLDRKDFNESLEILKRNEYKLYINHIDCIALKKNIHLF